MNNITSAEIINKQLEIKLQAERDIAISAFVKSLAAVAREYNVACVEVGGVKLTMTPQAIQDKGSISHDQETDESLLFHSA